MDLILVNGHRQVPGYLPGSNLGMNILLQLAVQRGYTARMLQDYVGKILREIDLLAGKDELPRVMGFYTDFNNITWTEKLIRYVKRKKPQMTVIVGGPQAAGLAGDFLERTGADVICPGEGEESLMELLDYYLRGIGELRLIRGIGYLENGEYFSTPQRLAKKDLDDIPWPDLSLCTDYAKVIFPILTGRGCPMGCTFCYEGANSKNVRFISSDRVLEEVERRAQTDPTLKYINFLDDTFTLKPDRVKEICSGLARLRLSHDFVWFASGHANTVRSRPGLIRMMVDAGLEKMFFGFESGSDEMLKRYNKHTTSRMILETVLQCVEEGLHQVAGNFILGGPFENRRTLQDSYDLVDRLLEAAPGQVDTSYFSFLPYPNTPITKDPAGFGMEITDDYIDCCLEDIPLSFTRELSYRDLMEERLRSNYLLQRKMRRIYEEGKIPEKVILDTYEDRRRYYVYSKWMDYVYSHYPIDNAYWTMRAGGGFCTMAQTSRPEDCFVSRTFEIWDYYDTGSDTILKIPVKGLPMELLKLCTGKLRLGQIRHRLAGLGYSADQLYACLKDFEKRKWILFTEI